MSDIEVALSLRGPTKLRQRGPTKFEKLSFNQGRIQDFVLGGTKFGGWGSDGFSVLLKLFCPHLLSI